MQIRIRLFASLAAIAGARELLWELDDVATPATLWARLVARYPAFERHAAYVKVAVNHEYTGWDELLGDGDEVAFLTPVSGGMSPLSGVASSAGSDDGDGGGERMESAHCWVTASPLSVDEILGKVNRPEAGAIVLFAGVVRRVTGQRITEHLEYDAYPEMALAEMEKIIAQVQEQWPEATVAICHRTGTVGIGEASVLIAVSTPHRTEAFAAGKFAIDELKKTVPIWKKEVWADGEMWVGDVTAEEKTD